MLSCTLVLYACLVRIPAFSSPYTVVPTTIRTTRMLIIYRAVVFIRWEKDDEYQLPSDSFSTSGTMAHKKNCIRENEQDCITEKAHRLRVDLRVRKMRTVD